MHVPFPFIPVASPEDRAKVESPSTQMAVALGNVKRPGEVYAGTVSPAEKARRRRVGKAARSARKAARG
jgi:hypothetical protein